MIGYIKEETTIIQWKDLLEGAPSARELIKKESVQQRSVLDAKEQDTWQTPATDP